MLLFLLLNQLFHFLFLTFRLISSELLEWFFYLSPIIIDFAGIIIRLLIWIDDEWTHKNNDKNNNYYLFEMFLDQTLLLTVSMNINLIIISEVHLLIIYILCWHSPLNLLIIYMIILLSS